MERQLKGLGVKEYRFVTAVDARGLTIESAIGAGLYSDVQSRRWHENGLTINEIACSLSHAECYRLIVEAGHERAIVLEDDVLFRAARMRFFRRTDIPDWTDIVFLNAFLYESPPKGHIQGMVYGDASYCGSAAAYMISRNCAIQLLSQALPVIHAADGLVGRALEHAETTPHAFRQQGCTLSLKGAIIHPELAINGSTEHYHRTSIRAR
jgi:glycosyl transferase family 25